MFLRCDGCFWTGNASQAISPPKDAGPRCPTCGKLLTALFEERSVFVPSRLHEEDEPGKIEGEHTFGYVTLREL